MVDERSRLLLGATTEISGSRLLLGATTKINLII